ncbi:hypothetical protein RZS08_26170, partial [Arthrospira platensis SPKY1]|nr:hypothetical protein [Arthrospira platensis SPKY1]
QELVTNVIKHSNCKQMKFIVYEKEMNYVFEIIDDGVSFDFYSNVKASYGMGLKNISSRLKYLNARLVQLPLERGNQIQIYLNFKANVTNSNN